MTIAKVLGRSKNHADKIGEKTGMSIMTQELEKLMVS